MLYIKKMYATDLAVFYKLPHIIHYIVDLFISNFYFLLCFLFSFIVFIKFNKNVVFYLHFTLNLLL